MIHIWHRSLIVLLVLLQLVAPLVHAHSEQVESPEGIHLPGLEFVSTQNNGAFLATISSHSKSDGTVISISSGIHHKNFSQVNTQKFYLITNKTQRVTANFQCVEDCLPEGFMIQHNIYLRSGFARAPPGYSI